MKDDYISRKAALDALGVTKNATKYGGDHSGYDTRMLYEIHDVLTGLPSADVAPVVRCKECKFRENDDFCTGRGFPCQLVPDDGFCDKGERKE
jgi:hypothetical protein